MDYRHRYQLAINFIEAHLFEPLTLDAIAGAAHQSSFHFARVFRALTGLSVMAYVRRRRLTHAVLALRQNDPRSLLDIGVDIGFDSQQGFTNAFKQSFGITPGTYRKQPFALPIQETLNMTDTQTRRPRGPEYRSLDAFQVAGLAGRYTVDTRVEIPQLWLRFGPMIGSVPNQVGAATYGVCVDMQGQGDEFTYVAAVEVSAAPAADDYEHRVIPAADYAVFTHEGSLDHIGDTMGYIFGEWLANCGHKVGSTPDFERYDERFDPMTGSGEFEIWVPIKRN
ncbi:MAG: AraC family transcriptional regulator [Pseudomonadota bacterium]